MGASSSRGRVGAGVGVGGEPIVQGKPCLSILITVPAACVAFAPLPHVAIRSNSFVEKEHL